MEFIQTVRGAYSRDEYIGEITRNMRTEDYVEIKLDNESYVNKAGKRSPTYRRIARKNIVEMGICRD